MSDSVNGFFWYELATSDIDAATAFYRGVVGWTSADFGQPGMPYVIFEAAGRGVGGAYTLTADDGDAKPGWTGYVKVPDADAAVAKLTAAGGAVRVEPADIPNVGRFAEVADPQGAVFKVLAPDGEEQPPIAPKTPGHIGWHELMAADGGSAFDFYAGQFGWTKDEPYDMGPMGVYQLFAMGGEACGGIMTKPAEVPVPSWLFYVNVDGGADAAAARVTEYGGQVLFGPTEVPGGDWIVQGLDPQGAMFALVAAHK